MQCIRHCHHHQRIRLILIATIICARNADELAQAREVALAHDYVEDALRARADAVYLPDDEPARVVGMPSEQYRLALTRKES